MLHGSVYGRGDTINLSFQQNLLLSSVCIMLRVYKLCFHSDMIIAVPYKVPASERKYFRAQELKIVFHFYVHCAFQLAKSHDLITLSRVVGRSNVSTSGENSLFLDSWCVLGTKTYST
jgi:hypothetical protein